MTDDAILRLDGVTKRFGGLVAVDHVSLEIPQGKIIGLIGPNGAGKTTLFNTINGVYPPDEGSVRFRGETITGLAPYKVAHRGIAKAHQIPKPLPELTVLQNAMTGAAFGRMGAGLEETEGLADEALAFVGLGGKRDALARQLNAAEKKKLELARALAAQPYLLLLDEVAAGLNPTEVDRLLHTLREIRARGQTILMVEHVMQAVMGVSDAVIVLHEGHKIAEGAPEEMANDERVIEAYLGAKPPSRRGGDDGTA